MYLHDISRRRDRQSKKHAPADQILKAGHAHSEGAGRAILLGIYGCAVFENARPRIPQLRGRLWRMSHGGGGGRSPSCVARHLIGSGRGGRKAEALRPRRGMAAMGAVREGGGECWRRADVTEVTKHAGEARCGMSGGQAKAGGGGVRREA